MRVVVVPGWVTPGWFRPVVGVGPRARPVVSCTVMRVLVVPACVDPVRVVTVTDCEPPGTPPPGARITIGTTTRDWAATGAMTPATSSRPATSPLTIEIHLMALPPARAVHPGWPGSGSPRPRHGAPSRRPPTPRCRSRGRPSATFSPTPAPGPPRLRGRPGSDPRLGGAGAPGGAPRPHRDGFHLEEERRAREL